MSESTLSTFARPCLPHARAVKLRQPCLLSDLYSSFQSMTDRLLKTWRFSFMSEAVAVQVQLKIHNGQCNAEWRFRHPNIDMRQALVPVWRAERWEFFSLHMDPMVTDLKVRLSEYGVSTTCPDPSPPFHLEFHKASFRVWRWLTKRYAAFAKEDLRWLPWALNLTVGAVRFFPVTQEPSAEVLMQDLSYRDMTWTVAPEIRVDFSTGEITLFQEAADTLSLHSESRSNAVAQITALVRERSLSK